MHVRVVLYSYLRNTTLGSDGGHLTRNPIGLGRLEAGIRSREEITDFGGRALRADDSCPMRSFQATPQVVADQNESAGDDENEQTTPFP